MEKRIEIEPTTALDEQALVNRIALLLRGANGSGPFQKDDGYRWDLCGNDWWAEIRAGDGSPVLVLAARYSQKGLDLLTQMVQTFVLTSSTANGPEVSKMVVIHRNWAREESQLISRLQEILFGQQFPTNRGADGRWPLDPQARWHAQIDTSVKVTTSSDCPGAQLLLSGPSEVEVNQISEFLAEFLN
jgi:hypothetical protein